MSNTVRYRVKGVVFVNGSLIDPQGRKDVFVHAAPGLEGSALELAPEGGSVLAISAAAPPDAPEDPPPAEPASNPPEETPPAVDDVPPADPAIDHGPRAADPDAAPDTPPRNGGKRSRN